MSAKHTPAPWDYWRGVVYPSGTRRVEEGVDHIAHVVGPVETADANGRLIAAAPEMLEALIRCVGELEYAAERLPYSNARYALKQVRAAIAKANGGRP